MTQSARRVLSDCRIALQLLEETTDLDVWRVHWVGALALIRAVGHVLDKVDGQNRHLRKLAQERFKEWKKEPEHEIFQAFIERERNTILKQYEFGYEKEEEVGVVLDGGFIHFLDENIYRPLNEGYGKNEDARDVYREAIDWWEARLEELENELRKSSP